MHEATTTEPNTFNKKVADSVYRTIRKNPNAKLSELFDKAKETDPSIGELSMQQFHGRYNLHARRRLKAESNGSADPGTQTNKTSRTNGRAKSGIRTGGIRTGSRASSRTSPVDSGWNGSEERIRGYLTEFAMRASRNPSLSDIDGAITEYTRKISSIRSK